MRIKTDWKIFCISFSPSRFFLTHSVQTTYSLVCFGIKCHRASFQDVQVTSI